MKASHGFQPVEDVFGLGDSVQCPFPTVTSAFYHHATTVPTTVAIRDLSTTPRELTYNELAQHAQALASHLRNLGVGPEQRIPLVVKRGLEMVVGIWAILSCGAQYVPLDGGVVPDSTIRHVVEQSGGQVVLCLTSTEYRIRDLCPGSTPVIIEENMTPDDSISDDKLVDLATSEAGCYVIYTSGRTHLGYLICMNSLLTVNRNHRKA